VAVDQVGGGMGRLLMLGSTRAGSVAPAHPDIVGGLCPTCVPRRSRRRPNEKRPLTLRCRSGGIFQW
jgi:hypothetical protein